MSDKRLKYEKPVSIDLGRVAPVLGDTCSIGNGAADCPAGMNNATVAVCSPAGSSADNDCRTGSGAGTFCWPTGSGAQVYCLTGDGFGVQASSYEMERDTSGMDSYSPKPFSAESSPLESPAESGGTSIPVPETDTGGTAFP